MMVCRASPAGGLVMAHCTNCGTALKDGARFCASCGAPAPAQQPPGAAPAAAPPPMAAPPYAPGPGAAQMHQPTYAAPGAAAQPAWAPVVHHGSGIGQRIMFHLRRALDWNLRAVTVEPAERERLIALSVDEEDARRYLVWRRSVLLVVTWPTLLSALLALIAVFGSDYSNFSELGVLLEYVRVGALFALPATAWVAAKQWDCHRRSRTTLLRGWLVAFLTPLLLALFPFAWRVDMSGADATMISQATAALSFLGAITVYVTLMPAVLSLIPGVLRACLRVKALIPESILPGWFLVASTPLYVLLFLVIFSTVNQIAGNVLLIVAVLSLLGAPLLYLVNSATFTRPLHTPEETARIGAIQRTVYMVSAAGITLLLVYAFTGDLFGKTLLGTTEANSLLRPWDVSVFQFPLEYFVRSLFTTVLVADLFMMMNLAVWRDTKAFAGSPQAGTYDRLMSEIEEAGQRR